MAGGGMSGKRAKRGTPQAWIEHAETELAHARHPMGEALAVECFHAHQAIEKAVKAVYVSRQVAHPYVHDIKTLLDGLEDHGVAVSAAAREAESMTIYATETRYPDSEPVSAQEHAEAVRIAAAVLEWAKMEIARA